MKKNKYIFLILLSFIFATGCDNETDLLFDETGAERKTEAILEFDELLKSADQGWLFQYYPHETQKYGGYNYIVKFKEDDKVDVYYEIMDDYKVAEESMYDIIAYGGPVLTFNTYNSLMHLFATPSLNEYQGKKGDFEFLLLEHNTNTITLRGVKSGNILKMTRMKETPEAFFTDIAKINKPFRLASLEGTLNGEPLAVKMAYRNITMSIEKDGTTETVEAPFILTKTGISFYEHVTINSVTFEEMNIDLENLKLTTADGKIVLDIVAPGVDLTRDIWCFNGTSPKECCPLLLEQWAKADAMNTAYYGETLLPQVFIGQSILGGGILGMSFYSLTGPNDGYKIHWNLTYRGVKGHADYLHIVKEDGGVNIAYYEYLEPILNTIIDNSPFVVKCDNDENPTQVRMESAANPEIWYVLSKF